MFQVGLVELTSLETESLIVVYIGSKIAKVGMGLKAERDKVDGENYSRHGQA